MSATPRDARDQAISLIPASENDKPTLANLLHLYVHDFSEFLGMTPSKDGWFAYPNLSSYFGQAGRAAFLIMAADNLVGFALTSRGSRISDDPLVMDVAEFFVVRGARRRGVGQAAAHKLFSTAPGAWEVRVQDANVPAQLFWQRAVAQYTRGNFSMEPWTRDDGTKSRVLRFNNGDAK